MVDRAYTDAELEAAIAAIADPERLRLRAGRRRPHRPVAAASPRDARSRRVAGSTSGHNQVVHEATGHDDATERVRAVQTLLAEETRLGMLVGVAVGFELARELAGLKTTEED